MKKTEELIEATLDFMRRRPASQKSEQREKRCVRTTDFRLFTNTIKQSLEIIRSAGMEVDYADAQAGEECEIHIRIRRNAAETA